MTTASDNVPTRVQPNAFGCITIPFLLIAMVPLAWGARAQWSKGELKRAGQVVSGRVTEVRYQPGNPSAVRRGSSGGQPRGESPVVVFTTRAGEARTAVGSVNRRPAAWAVGDVVDVVYDPSDPSRADLRSEVDGWRLRFAIWCGVAAIPLTIASLPVILLIRERRRDRSGTVG